MNKLKNFQFIFNTYAASSFFSKIFIFIRYLVCPWNALMETIDKASRILDIGCGHGLFLHMIKDKYPNAVCIGYDHDHEKIKIAQATKPQKNLSFLYEANADQLKPVSFDVITLIDVLYSVPLKEWNQIFNTVEILLKPGGTLLIKETVTSPKLKYYICFVQEWMALNLLRYTKGDSPKLMSIAYYLQQIEKMGFTIVQHKRLDFGYLWPHYLFISKKHSL